MPAFLGVDDIVLFEQAEAHVIGGERELTFIFRSRNLAKERSANSEGNQ